MTSCVLLPIDDTDDALNPKGAESVADVDNEFSTLEDNPKLATTKFSPAEAPTQLLDRPRGEEIVLLKEPTVVMVDDKPNGADRLPVNVPEDAAETDSPNGAEIVELYVPTTSNEDDKPRDALTLTDITPLVSSDVVEKGADENALNPSIT